MVACSSRVLSTWAMQYGKVAHSLLSINTFLISSYCYILLTFFLQETKFNAPFSGVQVRFGQVNSSCSSSYQTETHSVSIIAYNMLSSPCSYYLTVTKCFCYSIMVQTKGMYKKCVKYLLNFGRHLNFVSGQSFKFLKILCSCIILP